MKQMIICCALLLIGCTSSSTRKDWDSGAGAQGSYEQQRMEDTRGNVKNEFPSARPATEDQPF